MSRVLARESAYKLIFEYMFSKEYNEHTFDIFASVNMADEDVAYMQDVYRGVVKKYDQLIDVVKEYAVGYAIDRIYRLDLAALLLAIYEIKYMDDIPVSVSISEAVNLVKRFSTEKSSTFVNGVLSSVAKAEDKDNDN